MAQIVSSRQESSYLYYVNRAYLEKGLSNDQIHPQGDFENHSPQAFEFQTASVSNFTKSAKARVRDYMVGALLKWLPALPKSRCQEAFDCLFNHHYYREYLSGVGQTKAESVFMLIFVNQSPTERYVAHAQFSCISKRNERNTYTVNANLSCQRYTYFELKQTDLAEVLRALQNMHMNPGDAE